MKRGGTKAHPLYSVYMNMLARCSRESLDNYKYYGGRGVKVCKRWLTRNGFKNFINDVGERPEGYSLDRIDVNGNYEPKNVKWSNHYEQMSNTRSNNPIIGVGWHKQRQKYRARIKVNGVDKSLGLYDSIEEALTARKRAEQCLL